MTPTHFPRDLTLPTKGLRRILPLMLAVASVADLATAPALRAQPIEWTVTGTVAFPGPANDTIAGSFTYDFPTTTELFATISLTGDPPYDMNYVQVSPISSFPLANEIIASATTGPTLEIRFADPLDGLNVPDPIAEVTYITSTVATDDTSVTGSATPVPEPTSLALLGVAVGLLLLSPGPNRRGRRLHPDQPEGL